MGAVMDKKLLGSWVVHHTNKLQNVSNQNGYDSTFVAGKAGILLSAISSNGERSLSRSKVEALAKSANINIPFELPKLIDILCDHELLDQSESEIATLGVTTLSILQHTADIFTGQTPSTKELAAIQLSEFASREPILSAGVSEKISDLFKLDRSNVSQLLYDSENIGFVDVEKISKEDKLFFNGNLFRRDDTAKIRRVLDSLTVPEQTKLNEFNEILRSKACVSIEFAKSMLGEQLFQKVSAIGLYDVNVVSNSTESIGFLTLPSAFSKFSSSIVEDAFDLAKAFISSITYGITKSSEARGQIKMVDALLGALVRGESVGPVPAIGEDYKILEMKGVVEVSWGSKKGRSGHMMKLLKKEVGELALQAIRQGDVSEHSLACFPTATVTKFQGPEFNRERIRKLQVAQSPKDTNDILMALRTGRAY